MSNNPMIPTVLAILLIGLAGISGLVLGIFLGRADARLEQRIRDHAAKIGKIHAEISRGKL